MQFSTSTIFIALLGVATAFPGLTPRQDAKKNGILICPSAEGTFANPGPGMAAICTGTFKCEYGSDGIKTGNVWTNTCTGCPTGQRPSALGNCVFQYV
ncbi:hypothetical protein IL306_003998 [Fusarium sp. DS 682]|nr:hypothetical protein IL306_003998 [Fusarium sp. DS 682]